ncbi:MAG: DUF5050 domain-containing protein, partial [Lachnospiraceae bacterium]|nr:DUF5050 domain-containing protein [Lachnospiraceae bacterium]
MPDAAAISPRLLQSIWIWKRAAIHGNRLSGNTGNLNNGGYFCEMDGRVYFANAYDNFALY